MSGWVCPNCGWKDENISGNEKTYKELFDWFWNNYPHRNRRKIGKNESFLALKKYVPLRYAKEFKSAVLSYKYSEDVKGSFSKDAKRFFKNNLWRWQDWVDRTEKQEYKIEANVIDHLNSYLSFPGITPKMIILSFPHGSEEKKIAKKLLQDRFNFTKDQVDKTLEALKIAGQKLVYEGET